MQSLRLNDPVHADDMIPAILADTFNHMNMKSDWPVALRLVSLAGGLVAINEPETNLVSLQSLMPLNTCMAAYADSPILLRV
jgi:hypothetical protein